MGFPSVLGTGLAPIPRYAVVREAGATVATTVTPVAPVVATAAGIVLMGEAPTWNRPLGAMVVVPGTALCQGVVRLPRPTPPGPGR